MNFVKMEGTGNDYVYVEAERFSAWDWPSLSRAVSDRHFGIGGDGLIVILPGERLPFRMAMFNADGSEGEMCGNGIRCVAKYLHDRRRIGDETVIETKAGPIPLRVLPGDPTRVQVDMGAPRLRPQEVPTTLGSGEGPFTGSLIAGGIPVEGTTVSMGNPHFVTFWDDLAEIPFEVLGPAIESHPAFPHRTNAEFAQVTGRDEITMRVWERGSGETLACGTGACATLVAAAVTGRTGPRATLHLKGGDLEVRWDDHVFLTGPAVEVFQGSFDPDQLMRRMGR